MLIRMGKRITFTKSEKNTNRFYIPCLCKTSQSPHFCITSTTGKSVKMNLILAETCLDQEGRDRSFWHVGNMHLILFLLMGHQAARCTVCRHRNHYRWKWQIQTNEDLKDCRRTSGNTYCTVCSVPLCYMVGLWVYAGLVQRIKRCWYTDKSLSFALLSCWFCWHAWKWRYST